MVLATTVGAATAAAAVMVRLVALLSTFAKLIGIPRIALFTGYGAPPGDNGSPYGGGYGGEGPRPGFGGRGMSGGYDSGPRPPMRDKGALRSFHSALA